MIRAVYTHFKYTQYKHSSMGYLLLATDFIILNNMQIHFKRHTFKSSNFYWLDINYIHVHGSARTCWVVLVVLIHWLTFEIMHNVQNLQYVSAKSYRIISWFHCVYKILALILNAFYSYPVLQKVPQQAFLKKLFENVISFSFYFMNIGKTMCTMKKWLQSPGQTSGVSSQQNMKM